MKIILLLFSLLLFQDLFGQIDNSGLQTPLITEIDTSSKKLAFKADLFCYLKNNEYFNPLMDGYSLFGYWANPKLNYQPHKNVTLEAGIFASRNFGSQGFDTLMPTMTLRIKEKNWNFLFGNLEGSYNHRLIEPLYDYEKGLRSPMEQGFQAKYVKNKTFLDMWVDWQLFTKPGKNSQEHISGNLSYFHKPVEFGSFSIVFPIQFQVYHRGGQNIPLQLPITTSYNLAIGNHLTFYITDNKKIILENYFVNYIQDSVRGSGYLANLRFQTRKFQFITTYWNGFNYSAPEGGALYLSNSTKLGSTFYSSTREILIFRIIYNTKITDALDLSIRVEPFYDFKSKKTEHSAGLYLVYRVPRIGIF